MLETIASAFCAEKNPEANPLILECLRMPFTRFACDIRRAQAHSYTHTHEHSHTHTQAVEDLPKKVKHKVCHNLPGPRGMKIAAWGMPQLPQFNGPQS